MTGFCQLTKGDVPAGLLQWVYRAPYGSIISNNRGSGDCQKMIEARYVLTVCWNAAFLQSMSITERGFTGKNMVVPQAPSFLLGILALSSFTGDTLTCWLQVHGCHLGRHKYSPHQLGRQKTSRGQQLNREELTHGPALNTSLTGTKWGKQNIIAKGRECFLWGRG